MGSLFPSNELCEECYEEIIEEFNEDQFWFNLGINLGKLDFMKTMTKEEEKEAEKKNWLPERVHSFYDNYEKEFEKHGTDRLFIKEL